MDSLIRTYHPTGSATHFMICVVGAVVATAIIIPVSLYLRRDFLAFKALGPGGTPCCISGYIRVKLLSLFALRDPYRPAAIPEELQSRNGYLADLPRRTHARPETRGIAPHRQITQRAQKSVYDSLADGIVDLGRQDAENLLLGTSCFEKHGTALFSVSPAKKTCRGEICHAHPSDGSMHLTLHPLDARIVLEAGWGERHPLSRGGVFERFVPKGFLMIYAPRNHDEIAVVLDIVRAAAWYVSGLSMEN